MITSASSTMSTLLGRKKAISRPNPNATTHIPMHLAMPCTHIPPSLFIICSERIFATKKRCNFFNNSRISPKNHNHRFRRTIDIIPHKSPATPNAVIFSRKITRLISHTAIIFVIETIGNKTEALILAESNSTI